MPGYEIRLWGLGACQPVAAHHHGPSWAIDSAFIRVGVAQRGGKGERRRSQLEKGDGGTQYSRFHAGHADVSGTARLTRGNAAARSSSYGLAVVWLVLFPANTVAIAVNDMPVRGARAHQYLR